MDQGQARLKVHRRAVVLDGHAATVLRLRPGGKERFATNLFHDTWHVLSDPRGAWLLGRLCWALAYQRRPGTLIVLHEPEVVPNLFDADPSSTIVITNPGLGPFNGEMASALRGLLRQPAKPDGTVVLQTSGLDLALADATTFWEHDEHARWRAAEQRRRTWVERVNGTLVLSAPPPVLRAWGVALSKVGERFYHGSDYAQLDWPASNGEVQVFPDFLVRVTRAEMARELHFPGRSHQELAPDERAIVWEATKNGNRSETP